MSIKLSQKLLTYLGGGFSVSASQGDNTLVNLDSRNDAFFLKNLHKGFPGSGILIECLLKKDLKGNRIICQSRIIRSQR